MRIFRERWARTTAIGLAALGALALILGYVGVSGTAYTAEQIPYLASGAVGGIFLLGLAATLFLSADLHDEWKKLDEIEQRMAQEPTANGDSDTAPMAAIRNHRVSNRTTAGNN